MQVHFLHEDAIVEAIQTTIDQRMAGANASRTFMAQTLLPGAVVPDRPSTQQGSSDGVVILICINATFQECHRKPNR